MSTLELSRSSYKCPLCFTASFSDDCTHGNETLLTSNDGYLAMFPRRRRPSTAAGDQRSATPASGSSCPWILSTETGRRFNVTWRLASPSAASLGAAGSHYDGKPTAARRSRSYSNTTVYCGIHERSESIPV